MRISFTPDPARLMQHSRIRQLGRLAHPHLVTYTASAEPDGGSTGEDDSDISSTDGTDDSDHGSNYSDTIRYNSQGHSCDRGGC